MLPYIAYMDPMGEKKLPQAVEKHENIFQKTTKTKSQGRSLRKFQVIRLKTVFSGHDSSGDTCTGSRSMGAVK
jgi:hypothetical protein